ncbi:hypothetical protein FKP32DRAFT_1587482 [Trametes sanguinea]|nr:hypothetical protein FKP32DRAFT_1587482 [Trametes sanguinea]
MSDKSNTHGATVTSSSTNELTSFDFHAHRTKYFERQSKEQATRIIDLEAKVAYLEAKVQHLEECLERERAKQEPPAAAESSPPSPSQHPASIPYRHELDVGSKRPASPEPPLFENRLPSLRSPLDNPAKKIKLEQSTSPQRPIEVLPSMMAGPSRRGMEQPETHHTRTTDTSSSQSRIGERMAAVPWLPLPRLRNLPPHLQDFTVDRRDLCKRPLFISSKLRFTRNGRGRNFIFLDTDHSPLCPAQPGAPGLLFSVSNTPQWRSGLQSVFTTSRLGNTSPSKMKYLYVGEYRLRLALPLSAAEYATLSLESKKTHAWSILRDRDYEQVQQRLVPDFRKAFVKTVNGEELYCTIGPNETTAIRADSSLAKELMSTPRKINQDEAMNRIMQAYQRGDEQINVWIMECVGFDEALLREIYEMTIADASGNVGTGQKRKKGRD